MNTNVVFQYRSEYILAKNCIWRNYSNNNEEKEPNVQYMNDKQKLTTASIGCFYKKETLKTKMFELFILKRF